MPILLGDCLDILKQIGSESIDLVYLDPPFFTQRNHTLKTRNNDSSFTIYDKWDSLDDYLRFMKLRLIECHRTLKDTGSIYLHCDKNASHYLRILLDEVFGMENFRNEIIWTYKRWTNSKNSLQCNHQSIYFYSKTAMFKFNTLFTEYSASTNVDQILQERVKNEHGKSKYKANSDGSIVLGKAKKGVPLGDVWQIPYLNPTARERVGYPTQKPIMLLERIIEISTDVGDILLDPFCGCGTSLVAACMLDRKYIGIDISADAVDLANERLENPIKTNSILLKKGEADYINKTEAEMNILNSLDATPVQRNAGIDGFLKTVYGGELVPIKIQKASESLIEAKEKLLHAAHKRNCRFMLLVRTHENYETQLLFEDIDTEVFVIDSFDLSVRKVYLGIERSLREAARQEA